jgi:hypothetical protein
MQDASGWRLDEQRKIAKCCCIFMSDKIAQALAVADSFHP